MSNIFKQPCDAGVIQSGQSHTPCSRRQGAWVLAATILGSGMVFIDGTVVNVALPVLQGELGASVTQLQWIVESYALFLAALLLVGGALGDRFGRRRLFAIGVALFAISSAACGLSRTATDLIIFRGAQGVGGALLVPGSLAIISAAFAPEQRGRAIGIWAGATAITSSLGPLLGGYLVENLSWRWIFFLNLPLAVAIFILLKGVPESRDDRATAVDWPGATLATLGLGSLVFGLIEAADLGVLHPLVVGTMGAGALFLVLFLLVQRHSRTPMMPLSLFHSRTFTGTNLLTFFLYSALSGVLFLLPFNLIQVQGYSPTAAGAAFLPLILLISLLSSWAGGLVDRYGARPPLIIGPFVAALGFLLFTLPSIGGSYWVTFFPGILVLGVGMSISVAPLATTVMGAVVVRRAGVASGINNAVSRTAGLMAIAMTGLLALASFNDRLDERLQDLVLAPDVMRQIQEQRVQMAGIEIPSQAAPATQVMLENAIHESFVDSFRVIMFLAAGLALAGSVCAMLTIQEHRRAT